MLNLIANKKLYSVFDIGTEKIACLSFRIENDKPTIIGMDHQKSYGFERNKLIDKKKLSSTIIKTLKRSLPKNIKYKNNLFFSNITDINSITKKNYTDINSGKLGVTKKDVRKVFKKCILESKIKGKFLIHSYPINFRINDKRLVDDPIGQKCKKLGVSSFNMMIDSSLHKKLKESFEKKKIGIKNFFDTGVASSIASLTENEKKDGVACIDICSASSKVTVYLNNKIVYSDNIPLGGGNVTNDIAKGLNISSESAEHAKIINGTLNLPFNEKIEINTDNNKKEMISKNLLYGILKPRYEEILEIIRDNIFDNIYARVSIKSIVITGGASKILGLINLAENVFNRKTRIGMVYKRNSYFYNKPEFSTLLGMVRLAKDHKKFEFPNELMKSNLFTVFDKLENWIEESYA
ncbi:MAG: cell division protein FtsA [Pseudomonadota bacterium]|nr:cell division protein FtsA [Pseudomonadota bacterium]